VAAGRQVNGAADPGVDPLVALLLRRMDDQDGRAERSRDRQTEAFTEAVRDLGTQFSARIDAQTQAMIETQRAQTSAMKWAAGLATTIVVVALLLLGSIGGAVISYKGGGLEATTNGGTP
jgi:hypothetical protein